MSIGQIPPAQAKIEQLQSLLQRARHVKQTSSIEPPLSTTDIDTSILHTISTDASSRGSNETVVPSLSLQSSLVETAATSIFYDFLASSNIDEAAFVEIWNLLDILQIAADNGHCEPGLALRLVEELLDSQTISGCRKVFDYLDSRRERLVAKDWNKKYLIVLRTCNELLRRLSRAEDADFCGRVFFFLFQSFPLGDRSSVNLRGEFHTENTTTFDEKRFGDRENRDGMDIDGKGADGEDAERNYDGKKNQESAIAGTGDSDTRPVETTTKTAVGESTKVMDTDSLYPIFWSLQHSFSNPIRLFDQPVLEEFKQGLEATIAKFKDVPKVLEAASTGKHAGLKRKRGDNQDTFASIYNPKYLTSKDLFNLELSDLAFQRHILVQALIIINFLLSLTPKAKAKQLNLSQPNKSVIYNYTLSDGDSSWALRIKQQIASYLREGPEGNFYYRMVDNVLARDKNWVRWKMESCPPIGKDSVSAQEYIEAKAGAKRACGNKSLKSTPAGSLNLSFLSDADGLNGLEKLKRADRYKVPTPESFIKPIAEIDLDLEMAMTDEEKRRLEEIKATKMWRALRLASRSRLNMFEKLDDGRNLNCLLEEPKAKEDETKIDANPMVTPDIRVTNTAAETLLVQMQGEVKPRPVPASEAVMAEAVIK